MVTEIFTVIGIICTWIGLGFLSHKWLLSLDAIDSDDEFGGWIVFMPVALTFAIVITLGLIVSSPWKLETLENKIKKLERKRKRK